MKPYIFVLIIIFCTLILGIFVNGFLIYLVYRPFVYGNNNKPLSHESTYKSIISEEILPQPTTDNTYFNIHYSSTPVITISLTNSMTTSATNKLTPKQTTTLFYMKTPTHRQAIKPSATDKPTKTPKFSNTHSSVAPRASKTSTSTPSPTPPPFSGYLLISEIMVNPNGDQPQNEWIEINNPNPYEVNLTNFKLGDEETAGQSEGMYLFPEGLILLPNQLFVIANNARSFQLVYGFLPDAEFEYSHPAVPRMMPFNLWSNGVINLNNGGDEVILMDGANQILDAVSWGNSPYYVNLSVLGLKQALSLERYPSFTTNRSIESWRIQAVPNPGKIAPTPTITPTVITLTPTTTFTATKTNTPTKEYTPVPASNLLITEVFFPKLDQNYLYTWIKICNPDLNLYVSLDRVQLSDCLSLDNTEGLFGFPNGSDLGPNKCLIVAYQAEKFRSLYNKMPDFELQDTISTVKDLILHDGYNSFYLDINNDEIILLDEGQNIIDGIGWGNSTYMVKINFSIPPGTSIKRDINNPQSWIIENYPIP